MAYAVVHHFPGGTEEEYEASIAAVHPSSGTLPEGQIFHAAGPSDGGWTVMAVHDSQASWERFRDEIAGGFTSTPQETAFEVHNLQP